jgi:hypothetical protein
VVLVVWSLLTKVISVSPVFDLTLDNLEFTLFSILFSL